MTLALLFPGQGSQHVGMAKPLADTHEEARRTLEEADDLLGFSLSSIMAEGPEEELTATRHAQPAILTHSVAVLRVLGDRVDGFACAAGHSLGEFSAHVAAGTISFPDALRLVRHRGELMFRAGKRRAGTMAAVLGLSEAEVEGALARIESGVCVPANFNAPGQVVISGDVPGVEEGGALCREAGARRVMPLDVSGGFHSPLMEPAARDLEEELASIPFSDPRVPVYSNVTAGPVTSGEEARRLLIAQLTAPVRWAASVEAMRDAGVDRFLEVGPGSVLCGLSRRNARGIACASLGEPDELETFQAQEAA